jgi:DNA-binding MarR family transcriptional regulator
MAAPPVPAVDTSPSVVGALAGDLGWALGTVFRSYVKTVNATMADLPGGPRGYQVLASAVRDVPGTQLALAQQMGVDRTVMTYLLDDLEAAGLIERQPDPADRRVRRIAATDQGRTRLCQLDECLAAAEEHVLGVLDPADRATLRELLRRVATQAAAHDPTSLCQVAKETGVASDPPPAMTRRRSRRSG